jgi:hypothetical protein
MKRFRTNAMIFLVAVWLSLVLFYFTENPSFFSASILSLQDAQTMKANSWDIWYKNEKNILDVFLSDSTKDINYISLSIIYDASEIEINLDKIISQTEYEVLSNTQWVLVLKVINFNTDFDYWKSLFELPFSWKEPSILISEWSVILLNWENKKLSIWLLNQDIDDYHGF